MSEGCLSIVTSGGRYWLGGRVAASYWTCSVPRIPGWTLQKNP